MEPFDANIRKVIDVFSHPLWFIIKNEKVDCPCVDYSTKEAKPGCNKCIGTGKQVIFTRVMASHQNSTISLRGEGMGFSERNIVGVFYTYANTNIHEGDLIYDAGDIAVVQDVYHERSNSDQTVYWRIETAPLKANVLKTTDTIKAFLKEAGY